MNKERFECEYNWIIDNNKRNTNESLIVYDEECDILDDLCELLNELNQQISDLEAKLAESEKKILELQEDSIRDNQIYNEQLAEKEKEIESLRKRQFIDMTEKGMLELKVATQDQDKISFCIEKLEKVKNTIKLNYNNMFPDFPLSVEIKTNLNIIDNQIASLKKGVEKDG